MKFLVINGVNLNLTGMREKSVYGVQSLEEINAKIAAYAAANGDSVEFYQSNIEGELVNKLHEAYLQKSCDGILFNAGAYTHYSYALRDCIECINIPVVDVHMSNIYARETFRHTDVLADVCVANFVGRGIQGYFDAVEFLVNNHSTIKFIMDNL